MTDPERDSLKFNINLNTMVTVLMFIITIATIVWKGGVLSEQVATLRGDVSGVRNEVREVRRDVSDVRDRVSRLEGVSR